jgi:hypothetical protein
MKSSKNMCTGFFWKYATTLVTMTIGSNILARALGARHLWRLRSWLYT